MDKDMVSQKYPTFAGKKRHVAAGKPKDNGILLWLHLIFAQIFQRI